MLASSLLLCSHEGMKDRPLTSSSADADANRRRIDRENTFQAERKRQSEEYAASVRAAKAQRDLDADSRRRPEQRIYNIPLQKK